MYIHVHYNVHILTLTSHLHIVVLLCYLYRLWIYGYNVRIRMYSTYFYSLIYDLPTHFIEHGRKLRQTSKFLHLATPVFTSC
jgi:hypothetical protein